LNFVTDDLEDFKPAMSPQLAITVKLTSFIVHLNYKNLIKFWAFTVTHASYRPCLLGIHISMVLIIRIASWWKNVPSSWVGKHCNARNTFSNPNMLPRLEEREHSLHQPKTGNISTELVLPRI